MASKPGLFFAIPIIVGIVVVMTYFHLFSSPLVVAGIVVLYVIVSFYNRRKAARRKSNPTVPVSPKKKMFRIK